MGKKVLLLGVALLVLCCISWAQDKSWTGVVSDSHCAAKHSTASDAAASCVAKCVSGGAQYVLVSEGKVYQLGSQDKFKDFAGKSVKVTGSEDNGVINPSAVEAAP